MQLDYDYRRRHRAIIVLFNSDNSKLLVMKKRKAGALFLLSYGKPFFSKKQNLVLLQIWLGNTIKDYNRLKIWQKSLNVGAKMDYQE